MRTNMRDVIQHTVLGMSFTPKRESVSPLCSDQLPVLASSRKALPPLGPGDLLVVSKLTKLCSFLM